MTLVAFWSLKSQQLNEANEIRNVKMKKKKISKQKEIKREKVVVFSFLRIENRNCTNLLLVQCYFTPSVSNPNITQVDYENGRQKDRNIAKKKKKKRQEK